MDRTTAFGDRAALTHRVKELAKAAGFPLVGVASADPFVETEAAAIDRLRQGLMDGLPWYHEARARRGCRPRELLPDALSIIALGVSYHNPPMSQPRDGKLRGRVAMYAWGDDYHKVMERRAKGLMGDLQALGGTSARFYVDYGPMPDRAVAQRAGIGWFGKNTNLLSPGVGSFTLLAEILTNLDLEPDEPLRKNCGQCTLCIPACPTGAIPAPYVIDNTRCISYHTIENRGPIPEDLRPLMGDWVFGCDICQDVCPVNERAEADGDPAFAAEAVERQRPDLVEILRMTEESFQRAFQGSAVRRAKLAGLQRNACIALGNSGEATAIPALAGAMANGSPLVRGHAAWALGRIGGEEARRMLRRALTAEADAWVRQEVEAALGEGGEGALPLALPGQGGRAPLTDPPEFYANH